MEDINIGRTIYVYTIIVRVALHLVLNQGTEVSIETVGPTAHPFPNQGLTGFRNNKASFHTAAVVTSPGVVFRSVNSSESICWMTVDSPRQIPMVPDQSIPHVQSTSC